MVMVILVHIEIFILFVFQMLVVAAAAAAAAVVVVVVVVIMMMMEILVHYWNCYFVCIPKAQKAILDQELALMSHQHSGEDTSELRKKVEELKQEVNKSALYTLYMSLSLFPSEWPTEIAGHHVYGKRDPKSNMNQINLGTTPKWSSTQ